MASRSADMTVSWKSLAIAATTIALAAIASTAVVATAKKADALSVIVLGVAVVAFMIQIVVFIVQAAAATEQQLKAQEVYGSTLKVLATIEEKAEGTRQVVSTISEKMLVALLGKAIPEAASSGVSVESPEFSAAVAERVSRLASSMPATTNPAERIAGTRPRSTERQFTKPADDPISFPDKSDVRRVLPKMKDLNGSALQGLRYLEEDYARSRRRDFAIPAGLEILSSANELWENGLIRRIRKAGSERPVYVLKDDGLTAARILLAPDVPSDVPQEVSILRDKLKEHERELAEMFDRIRRSDIPVEE